MFAFGVCSFALGVQHVLRGALRVHGAPRVQWKAGLMEGEGIMYCDGQ